LTVQTHNPVNLCNNNNSTVYHQMKKINQRVFITSLETALITVVFILGRSRMLLTMEEKSNLHAQTTAPTTQVESTRKQLLLMYKIIFLALVPTKAMVLNDLHNIL